MTTRASGLHASALRQFGRLPISIRHFIVGLTSPAYRLGMVAVLTSDDGRLLLARHSYRQGWGLPGGMLGWNEEPETAIHRELEEELGIQAVENGPLVVRHRRRPRRVEYFFSLGLRTGVSPESVTPVSPEIEEVRWFEVDDLPRLERRPGNTTEVLPVLLARRFPDRFPAITDFFDS